MAGPLRRSVWRLVLVAVATATLLPLAAGSGGNGTRAASHRAGPPLDVPGDSSGPADPAVRFAGAGFDRRGSDGGTSTSTGPREAMAIGTGGIPEVALRAYLRAQEALRLADPSCGLRWSLLAAIGRVESDHGRFGGATLAADGRGDRPIRGIPLDGRPGVARIADTDRGALDGDRVLDRAVGPLQFIPSSWRAVAVDGNGDGRSDPDNIFDAALAAGLYLCAGDVDLTDPAQRAAAVRRYNHSDEYVRIVLALAAAYERGAAGALPDPGPLPSPVVRRVPTPSLPLPPANPGPPPALTEAARRHASSRDGSSPAGGDDGGQAASAASPSPPDEVAPAGSPPTSAPAVAGGSGALRPAPSAPDPGAPAEPVPPPGGDPSAGGAGDRTVTQPPTSPPDPGPGDPGTGVPPPDDRPDGGTTGDGGAGDGTGEPERPPACDVAAPGDSVVGDRPADAGAGAGVGELDGDDLRTTHDRDASGRPAGAARGGEDDQVGPGDEGDEGDECPPCPTDETADRSGDRSGEDDPSDGSRVTTRRGRGGLPVAATDDGGSTPDRRQAPDGDGPQDPADRGDGPRDPEDGGCVEPASDDGGSADAGQGARPVR